MDESPVDRGGRGTGAVRGWRDRETMSQNLRPAVWSAPRILRRYKQLGRLWRARVPGREAR